MHFAVFACGDLSGQLERGVRLLLRVHRDGEAFHRRAFVDAVADGQDRRGRIGDHRARRRADQKMGDMMPRVRRHHHEVDRLRLDRAADLAAGIGGVLHHQSRRNRSIRAADAVAQLVELELLGVFIDFRISWEAVLIADVQDHDLGAGRAGDADGVIEYPLRRRREVGRDEDAAPRIHHVTWMRIGQGRAVAQQAPASQCSGSRSSARPRSPQSAASPAWRRAEACRPG